MQEIKCNTDNKEKRFKLHGLSCLNPGNSAE